MNNCPPPSIRCPSTTSSVLMLRHMSSPMTRRYRGHLRPKTDNLWSLQFWMENNGAHTTYRHRYGPKLRAGETTAVQLLQAHLNAGDDAYAYVNAEDALAVAEAVDAGQYNHPMAGVPVVISDVFVTDTLPTAAGSDYLAGWIAPYAATAVSKLRAAGLPILAKAKVSEFGMGPD